MIYYFIPDVVRAGGIKVACQFTELLIECGVPAVIVTPDGRAPQWFKASTPLVSDKQAQTRIQASDWKMITWPPDYERLRSWPGKMINHCQGTDTRMDQIFSDAGVPVLTCWQQAVDYVLAHHGRGTCDVGIHISDVFFYDGTCKQSNLVAYMPRRGHEHVGPCIDKCPSLEFKWIDALDEHEVADRLKQTTYYLATAVGEEFGLPALEAMAAGCVVISVPVKGGLEYLRDQENCRVVEPGDMPATLAAISRAGQKDERDRLRYQGIATATRYRRPRQKQKLQNALSKELEWLNP